MNQEATVVNSEGLTQAKWFDRATKVAMFDIRKYDESAYAWKKPSDIMVHANYFFVPKKDGRLRLITDARAFNAIMDISRCPFTFFTLEALITAVARCQNGKKEFFALSCDMRHWFHQLTMPARYRGGLTINIPAQGADYGHEARPGYLARTQTMGASHSPVTAQASTWTGLLANMDGSSLDSLDVDMEFLAPYTAAQILPPWIPLKEGGGIFVMLDNIFICSPNERTIDKWMRRIKHNFSRAHFNIELKQQSFKQWTKGGAVRELTETVMKHRCQEGMPLECWPEFLGIRWGYDYRYIEVPAEELKLEGVVSGVWSGSYRDLASIFGKLLWMWRVGEMRLGNEGPAKLLRLYRKVYPSGELDWKSETELSAEDTQLLEEQWALRAAKTLFPTTCPQEVSRVAMVAVDAAADSSNEGLMATVSFNLSGEVTRVFAAGHGMNQQQIALAELRAAVTGVRGVLEQDASVDLIVLGTDNMNALHWISKGYARRDGANDLLQELDKRLGTRRLFVTYIPSENNAADVPSRLEVIPSSDRLIEECAKHSDWKGRREQTAALLRCGVIEATGGWARTGTRISGTTRARMD